MSYIGALGVNTFDDEIEDVSNTIVNRIVLDINDTSNYVWTTSDIFAKEIEHTSNYVWTTSALKIRQTARPPPAENRLPDYMSHSLSILSNQNTHSHFT
jgi:hypothetical protein